jgi:hypothetical protein
MRTTVDIDRDVLDAARNLARQERITLGRAVSRLARKGLQSGSGPDERDSGGLPSFAVAEDAPTFGTEDVKRALDDE